MPSFLEGYNLLIKKGSGKAVSSRGTEYKIKTKDGKIIAFPRTGRVSIHEDCWGKISHVKGLGQEEFIMALILSITGIKITNNNHVFEV